MTKPPLEKPHSGPHLARRSDVESYFLELFRAQIGAAPGAETELTLVAEEAQQWQYRMRLFHHGQWRERRMTIGVLGVGSGRRSQCFHVIFDTYLVVKIPPKPIADLSDYLERLEKEERIVHRLSGRCCVVPRLSAVLRRIKRFADVPDTDEPQLEARYRRWLEADPSRQRYLKIGDTFAFFMNFSRHRFLGPVLRETIWDTRRLAAAVAGEDAALVDDCAAFEQKYGSAGTALCFELNDLCAAFNDRARRVLREAAPDVVLTETETRNWLLRRAVQVPVEKGGRIGPSVAAVLTPQGDEVLAQYRSTVHRYRQLSHTEVQRRAMQKGRGPMAALGANLLDLLIWLGRHQVAMRDLKPDNLFVAGDPAQYPHFLSDPERFTIGLIDLENAVVSPSAGGAAGCQPQLGGTPAYATPSHFVPNVLLGELYDEIDQILHFQDWYAVVGILFEIVAGRRLFDRSGHMLMRWIGEIRRRGGRYPVGRSDYERFNRRFWYQARAEFRARTAAADACLRPVSVPVPEMLRDCLHAYLKWRGETLRRRIDALVATGDFIGEKQLGRTLASGGVASLERLMARCRQQASPANQRIGALLQKLVLLKTAQSQRAAAEQALAAPGARIPVKALLTMMFERVAQAMRSPLRAGDAPLSPAPDRPLRGTEALLVQCTHSLS